MSEEPGIADGEIIEEMKNLELMIAFHKKALLRNLTPSLFKPQQINGILNHSATQELWDSENYDAIRLSYASAWMQYYTISFSEELFYTEQQFADFFKID